MLEYDQISQIKSLYESGENVIQHINNHFDTAIHEAIMYSYDLQAGTYIQLLQSAETQAIKNAVGEKLAGLFQSLNIETLCEAGVGEATTLNAVLQHAKFKKTLAFDISMSRLLYAQQHLHAHQNEVALFCSDIQSIPFEDNAIDCVYTFHCLEPNRGREKELLSELLRVTSRYLVLIEPDYARFGLEQQQRMDKHNYVMHLPETLEALGAKIVLNEPWGIDANPLNKASLLVVEKAPSTKQSSLDFVSPISATRLQQVDGGYFSEEDGHFFPVVAGIPNFLRDNAVLVSHLNKVKLKS